jgi:imidazole glycerol-phosphate synthase subunit HisH
MPMPGLIIVDSGSANLSSVYKAARMAALHPEITDKPEIIAGANSVIFPGVGSFEHAAVSIREKQLDIALLKAIADGKPFLGICLGMQLLFGHSEESVKKAKPAEGLNILEGSVKRFPAGLPIPHVGWNKVSPTRNSPLFEGLADEAYFYFTHSYFVQPEHDETTIALTDYGFSFTSAVSRDNLYGVQFHPEKSGDAGLRLLANFGKIIADHY